MDSQGRELGRGLDAAFNRLTEALRTVEDQVRFDRAWPALAARVKGLRGRVRQLQEGVELAWGPLARYRDVGGDPGAPQCSDHAPERHGLVDLLRANLARARQSARSVEEALRVVHPALAAEAERVRYAIYEEEAVILRLLTGGARLADVRLYVLVTTALASCSVLDATAAAIAGGAQMIQLREKEMPRAELLALARELRSLTAEQDALLIINDYVDIAALCEADGVHQGQEDLAPAGVRRILGPDAIVGVSTHAPEQARRAEQDGASYLGVGPIFPTRTKLHREAVHPEYIREAQAVTSIPGFAIGSINRDTLDSVIEAGARRVAICTGIIASEEIEGTARWFRDRLDDAAARDRAQGC